MQIGTNTNDVAWEFNTSNGFDDEMLIGIDSLLDSTLGSFHMNGPTPKMYQSGRAIQRPYGLQYPELNYHPSDIYFFGDDLLVAPVLKAEQPPRRSDCRSLV